jgi:hypothetical protein
VQTEENVNEFRALSRRFKGQPAVEVFAHLMAPIDAGSTWDKPYERLAALAKPEEWNFHRPEFKKNGDNYPILRSYLNFTFLRLQQQGKIAYSSDGDRACFNTGLQTKNEKDIYASFFRNKAAAERDQPQWTLYGFFDSYSKKLSEFHPLPDIATYVDDPADLVFDTRYSIDVNYDHLFADNEERLPPEIRGNSTFATRAIEGAISILKEKVARNYKIAIPHWYRDKIQLLLPLNITSEVEADLALVADKDREAQLYRITTMLTMDMAYIDARLITRPDRDWLNP